MERTNRKLTMKIVTLVLVAASALCVAADAAAQGPLSDAEKKARAKAAIMKHLGGYLIQPGSQKGHVAFFNAQSRVGAEIFDSVSRRMRTFMHLMSKVYPQKKPVTPGNAVGLMEDVDTQAAVFLVESAELPALLTAPEQKWAIVNVGALAADKPDAEKLRLRVVRELWRGLAYACGAGVSSTPHCVMNPCFSLADLDAFDSDMISMEPFMTMREVFPKMGISPYRRVTYKMAVKEGWAPAPTNEFQKAIWDKGKAGADPTGRWKSDFGGGDGKGEKKDAAK